MIDEPSVAELIASFKRGVRGVSDELADVHDGSVYEIIGGAAALVWSKEAQYDTDKFHAKQLKTATGDALTQMGLRRYGIARILDTRGVGKATFSRSSLAAGAGTVWDGTRIRVSTSLTDSIYYQVVGDVIFAATDYSKDVPIESVEYGITDAVESNNATLDDSIWDNSFLITYVKAVAGTLFEEASDYVARIRKTRFDTRVGYQIAMIAACAAVGASRVALFPSNYGTVDYGINVCYVGFADYTSSAELVKKCQIALESFRCTGDQLQVLQMTPLELKLTAIVMLNDATYNFDLASLRQITVDSVIQDMRNNGAWGYRHSSMAGNVIRNIPAAQAVGITDGSNNFQPDNIGVLVNINGIMNFPTVLNRYFVQPWNVSVVFQGPQ